MCENLEFFLKTCSNFELYVVLIMKLSEARQTKKQYRIPSRYSAYCLFCFHAIPSLLFATLQPGLFIVSEIFIGFTEKKNTGRIDYLLKKHEERFSDAEFVIKPVTKPIFEDKPEHRAEIILSHPISAERISIASILCKSYLLQI